MPEHYVMVGVQKQGDVVLVQIEDTVLRIPVSDEARIAFHRIRLDVDATPEESE